MGGQREGRNEQMKEGRKERSMYLQTRLEQVPS